MMIPHLQNLDREKLKRPEVTLPILLQEIAEQNHANGYCFRELKGGSKHSESYRQWLRIRVDETEKISRAVQEEIIRRFDELRERKEAEVGTLQTLSTRP